MDLTNSQNITPELINSMIEQIKLCFKQVRPLVLERAGKSEFLSKHDGSPVTVTDSEVEEIIFKSINSKFPSIPVYGEESGYSDDLPDVCWLIDPIDGTASFVENIPTFTAMAALIVNGYTQACIIYNYSTNDMFIAQKDKGAYKNDNKLSLNDKPLPTVALCKGRHINPLTSILKEKNIVCEIAPNGGGYGFTAIADGKFAARFQLHSRGYIHDYAPGALLVQEAGGSIVPIKDEEYNFKSKSFVACHPELEDIIRTNIDAIRELEI